MDYRLYNPNYRDYPILLLSTVPVSDGQGQSGFPFLSMSRIYLAGTPPATVLAATSFVTTDPAAIMALSPTVTPRRRSVIIRSFPYTSLPISYASCNFGLPLISPACHTPPQNSVPFTVGFSRQSRNPMKLATIRSIIVSSSSAAVAMK